MSRTQKNILILISVLAMLLCVLCCLYIYQFFRGSRVNAQINQMAFSATEPETPPSIPKDTAEETPAEPEEVPEDAEPEEDDGVALGIDFAALSQVNDEIYAWLEIPGTGISYPVLQSQTDDLYYNTHSVDKSYYTGGSIYTQRYNTKTFDDPMTLVYGHNFHDQSLFAPLLNFADSAFFQENRTFFLYTPETVYEYTIFAAYPHTSEHLLLCYDFSDETQFDAYFDSLSDAINANYDQDSFPAFGDRIVTLSTCYRLSFGQRYLVQGVLTATYPVAQEAS